MSSFSLFSAGHINNSYVFFDFETTGFYPLDGDKIVEIAMIKIVDGAVAGRFETLINPLRRIPEAASEVNKITDEDLKDSPVFDRDMSLKVLNFIEDSILVAHNAPFDLAFLSMELANNGISFTGWRAIDTLAIAKEIFPGQKNKLKSLIDRYNIKQKGDLHRAMVDTEALVEVFFNLVSEENIRNLGDEDMVRKYGAAGDSDILYKNISPDIRGAMENASIVKGKYRRRDGETVLIKFIPVAPVWNGNRWYLYSIDPKTQSKLYLYPNRLADIKIGD